MDGKKRRIWRTAAEKRRIVEMTFEPGMSVSRVAQAEGINAHQVFDWRKAYREGRLGEADVSHLLPVVISGTAHCEARERQASEIPSCGRVHIELPGVACIRVESGADAALVRAIMETLRK